MNKNIHVIGSGFSSLAASCYLAEKGYKVTVLEKNDTLGGRARQYKKDGFTLNVFLQILTKNLPIITN